MDANDTGAQTGATPTASDVERTPEEMAWDEEFRATDTGGSVSSTLTELARLAAKAPGVLIQMPMSLLPKETRQHTRAAARESFLALRALLGAVGDGIERALADPGSPSDTAQRAVRGPQGTWGNTIQASEPEPAASGGVKMRRIELSDEAGAAAAEPAPGMAAEEGNEGRGLKADIDY